MKKFVNVSIFNGNFNAESVGLSPEFFDGYLARRLTAEELEHRSKLLEKYYEYCVDKKYIPCVESDFLGHCRKNGELIDAEYIPNADQVWNAMVNRGYVRKRFSWSSASRSIMNAIIPNFGSIYSMYLEEKMNVEEGTFSSDYCDPVDMFIDAHYETLKEEVTINNSVLNAEIDKLLPPAQRDMLEWMRGIGPYTSYLPEEKVIRKEVHSALRTYRFGDGFSNYEVVYYRLSDQDIRVILALHENLCGIAETCEFQDILAKAVL